MAELESPAFCPIGPASTQGRCCLLRDRGKHTIDIIVELGGVKPVEDDNTMERGHQTRILLPLPYEYAGWVILKELQTLAPISAAMAFPVGHHEVTIG